MYILRYWKVIFQTEKNSWRIEIIIGCMTADIAIILLNTGNFKVVIYAWGKFTL